MNSQIQKVIKVFLVVSLQFAAPSICLAAEDTAAAPDAMATIYDMDALWNRITLDGWPISPELVDTYLKDNLNTMQSISQETLGVSSTMGFIGGGILLAQSSNPSGNTQQEGVTIWPVVSFETVEIGLLRERSALLSLYLAGYTNTLKAVQWAQASGALTNETQTIDEKLETIEKSKQMVQVIQKRANGAHLELFVLHALFMLAGESQQEKCNALRQAEEQIPYLLWGSQREDAIFELPDDNNNWRMGQQWWALHDAAKTLYDQNAFANASALCRTTRPMGRTEVRQILADELEVLLKDELERAFANQVDAFEKIDEDFADAETAANVQLNAGDIFELEREVKNTATIFEWVLQDSQNLSALIASLKEKGEALQRIEADNNLVTETEQVAVVELMALQQIVNDVTAKLTEIVNSPALSDDQRNVMAECHLLSAQIFELPFSHESQMVIEDYKAISYQMDTCLFQVATVYQQLQSDTSINPGQAELARLVQQLSNVYLTVNGALY